MKKISLLIITIITLLIWKPILDQVPMGEGYYYFDRCQNKFVAPAECSTSIFQFDNLARITFQIMIPVFGDNIHLYMVSQVVMMILLYATFYLILLKTTKNNFFALFSTIIFLANHTGSFSMMATGNYQRFAQRVPNLIPLLTSFYFMVKYMDKRRVIDLFLFLTLFALSIYLAHHGIFLLPLFVSYLLIWPLKEKLNFKNIVLSATLILSIVFLSSIITKTDHFVPKQGVVEFVTTSPRINEKIFLQIPNLIVPTIISKFVANNISSPPILYPYSIILKYWLFILIPLFVIPAFKLKNNSNLNILYKSSLIALPLVCFLNLYAYGEGAPDPLRNFGEDRIYFISSILSSLMIGLLAYLIWIGRNKIYKVVLIILLIVYIFYNGKIIYSDSLKIKPTSTKMEDFIKYTKSKTMNPNSKIAIIGPSHLLWPSLFLNNFYNTNNNLLFVLDSADWKNILGKEYWDKIIIVDYDIKAQNKIVEKTVK